MIGPRHTMTADDPLAALTALERRATDILGRQRELAVQLARYHPSIWPDAWREAALACPQPALEAALSAWGSWLDQLSRQVTRVAIAAPGTAAAEEADLLTALGFDEEDEEDDGLIPPGLVLPPDEGHGLTAATAALDAAPPTPEPPTLEPPAPTISPAELAPAPPTLVEPVPVEPAPAQPTPIEQMTEVQVMAPAAPEPPPPAPEPPALEAAEAEINEPAPEPPDLEAVASEPAEPEIDEPQIAEPGIAELEVSSEGEAHEIDLDDDWAAAALAEAQRSQDEPSAAPEEIAAEEISAEALAAAEISAEALAAAEISAEAISEEMAFDEVNLDLESFDESVFDGVDQGTDEASAGANEGGFGDAIAEALASDEPAGDGLDLDGLDLDGLDLDGLDLDGLDLDASAEGGGASAEGEASEPAPTEDAPSEAELDSFTAEALAEEMMADAAPSAEADESDELEDLDAAWSTAFAETEGDADGAEAEDGDPLLASGEAGELEGVFQEPEVDAAPEPAPSLSVSEATSDAEPPLDPWAFDDSLEEIPPEEYGVSLGQTEAFVRTGPQVKEGKRDRQLEGPEAVSDGDPWDALDMTPSPERGARPKVARHEIMGSTPSAPEEAAPLEAAPLDEPAAEASSAEASSAEASSSEVAEDIDEVVDLIDSAAELGAELDEPELSEAELGSGELPSEGSAWDIEGNVLHCTIDDHLGHRFYVGADGQLGSGGLFVPADELWPVGSPVQLEFEIPGGAQVMVNTLVDWHQEAESEELPMGMALAFQDLLPQDEAAVEGYIEIYGTLPPRP